MNVEQHPEHKDPFSDVETDEKTGGVYDVLHDEPQPEPDGQPDDESLLYSTPRLRKKLEGQAEHKRLFLDAFADIPVLQYAANKAGVHRTRVWQWRQEDLLFAAAFEQAEQAGIDSIEQVAMERAKEGKSDLLLITILNAKRSDQYRQRGSIEHTGRDGGPMEVLNLSPEQRRQRIEELLALRDSKGKP